jgi:hypothetical protein
MRCAARRPCSRSPSTGSARAFPASGGSVNRLPFPRSTRHRRALPEFVAITLTSAQDSASETPAQHPALGPVPTPAGANAPVQRGESRLPFLGYRDHAIAKGLWRTSHDRTLRNRVRRGGRKGRDPDDPDPLHVGLATRRVALCACEKKRCPATPSGAVARSRATG